MSHILDFEPAADYRVADALHRLVKQHKRDVKQTNVYEGKITVPRDVVHAIGVGVTEGVEKTIHAILTGLPSRRSFVHSGLTERQYEDYNAVAADPFDAYTLSSFAIVAARGVANFFGTLADMLLLKKRAWNTFIWDVWRTGKKIWRVLVNPKLIFGVIYAWWLEVKKIAKALIFRNPGANILRAWTLMVIEIWRVWIVEASALIRSIRRYLDMGDKHGMSLFGWRIVVPGLDEPARPGWLAKKIRGAFRYVKRLLRRLWREVSSYSLGHLLQDIFGTRDRLVRSAHYEGLYANTEGKGYRLWESSDRYPNAYRHGGHRRQETHNRKTMASCNGRIVYP